MSLPQIKVEVGFDLSDSPDALFFRLDDAVRGRLDNTEYPLAGTSFIDVTDRALSVDIQRGKGNLLANYPPGEASVEFNNHDRAFDPLYAASPFVGNIVPRRELRISANDDVIYRGWIEDWDLGYQPSGDSVTVAKAYDALNIFASQVIDGFTPPVEKAGQRINRILDLPEVNWPFSDRDIEVGIPDIAGNPIPSETNVLNYFQNIALSEPGSVFINKSGALAFRDRQSAPTSATLTAFGEGGIPVADLEVVYGSELLYNRVTVSRQNGGTAIASDIGSQLAYGIRDLTIDDVQLVSDDDLIDFVLSYAAQYSEPDYRFENATVLLEKLSPVDQDKVLGLEIGDVCSIAFTPNNIPPQILRYVEVTRIEHQVTTISHRVALGFNQIRYAPLILDDAVFGKLDVGTLSW
jgi:hypothetical protein